MLGRSENAIRNECYELGLRKKAPAWTDGELDRLRGFYSGHEGQSIDLSGIEAVFLGRLKSNICRKARELGLTDIKRPVEAATVAKASVARKQWHREHEHPRGFAGHEHTDATKAILSQRSREMWANPDCALNSEEHRQHLSDMAIQRQKDGSLNKGGYSRCRSGKRADLNNLFVRSSWEANYARYLNFLIRHGEIASWEYEPDTFWFHEIKRGTRSYTPDFKVFEHDGSFKYHEVKGWMDQKSKTRLKRMAKYYSDVPLILVDAPVYYAIQHDVSSLVEHWEK